MRKIVLVLAVMSAMWVFPSAASAGPCGALGDVCYEIIHRPMNQLCNGWDFCPQ
jgi:hypothetical protein